MGWQHGKKLEIKPTSGRFLPNTSSWVSTAVTARAGSDGPSLLSRGGRPTMQRCRGTAEDFQSRSASLCIQVRAFWCMPSGYASLATRPPPVTRSYLGSCSSGNDELARPSQAADYAARSERVCQCSRRSRTFTLEQRGCQGCGCICVVAIDVLGQLSMAMWQARLVGTAAWWCGRSWAS